MDKSYVTLEQKLCPVCCKAHDSGALLLDQRLRKTFDKHTVTGWALCPDDKAKIAEGFIPLVGVDESKCTKTHDGHITPEGAYRTGQIAYLRRTAWAEVFNCPAPKKFCFIDPDIIDMLAAQTQQDGPAA